MQATSATNAHCPNCHADVTTHYDPVNHWKHLLLTLLTCGIWLPMWLISTFGPVKICDRCDDPIWED